MIILLLTSLKNFIIVEYKKNIKTINITIFEIIQLLNKIKY